MIKALKSDGHTVKILSKVEVRDTRKGFRQNGLGTEKICLR